jgi:hypothetical protein
VIVKKTYTCSKCGAIAREYEGLKGGLYIDASTPPECPKGGDHDFKPVEGPKNPEQPGNFMKENLEVKEFSLKKILENLDKIPRDGGAKFGGDKKKLTPQQKRELMEKVRKFNEYGKVLRCETALMEMSTTLSEIGQMAESYAMTESGDYFQAEVVKRDFNEVNKITKDFSKLARECYGGLQQLNALYEDMGRKMERYFEIQSLDEIASVITQDESSAPAPQIGEIADEEEEETTSLQEASFKKKDF